MIKTYLLSKHEIHSATITALLLTYLIMAVSVTVNELQSLVYIQLSPPIPPISGLAKKRRCSEIGGIGGART